MKNRIGLYLVIGLAAIIVLAAVLYFARKPTDWNGEGYFDDPITTVLFEETSFELGSVPNDTIVNRTYRFKNTGEKPLIIYYIDSGCYCTGYSVSDKTIQPNGTGEITLSLNTEEKTVGAFFVNAVVRMNTEDSLHSLRIEGNIVE